MAETYRGAFFIEEASLVHYLKDIARHKALTMKEEAELAVRIRKDDTAALEKLLKSNLRFVVSVARNYQNQGLPLADLINEGNLGLIRAAKRFDETKKFKFISYGVWWVRQAILQALAEQSRIVRLPLNRVGAIHKIGRISSRMEQDLKRIPSAEEIAHKLRLEPTEVSEALKIGNTHTSLDANFQDGEDGRLMDLLRDENADAPDDVLRGLSLAGEVERTLSTLAKREKDVVKLYFGIGVENAHTLEEIGKKFNLTRERVRQIKERAIKRLKHSSRSRSLRTLRVETE
ncbi:MAG: RNA polymerase sigma factor RpoD/SigA [Fibrobacterota bacterium]